MARGCCLVDRTRRAFTLVELLVVISILGIIAALAVPALKNLGKSNIAVSSSRQLLDDIGRARQLAISHHTTVYMVFVPTNFFYLNNVSNVNLMLGLTNLSVPADRSAALITATNLLDKQLTGYNFMSFGQVGDQPGRHLWHYLADWQTLPEGTFIAAAKFQPQNYPPLQIPQWQYDYSSQIDNWRYPSAAQNQIYGFAQWPIPFPTERSPFVYLPCLAFDYLGRLISETADNVTFHHAYIPLAEGSVRYTINPATRTPTVPATPLTAADVTETPAGNSTGIAYNVIDVDPFTGRATLQHFKIK